MYYYTGILPEGIKATRDNKYTESQLKFIGAKLFPDLNGQPIEVVAGEEGLGADYVDGRRKKRRSPSKRRRSPSKRRRSPSKKMRRKKRSA